MNRRAIIFFSLAIIFYMTNFLLFFALILISPFIFNKKKWTLKSSFHLAMYYLLFTLIFIGSVFSISRYIHDKEEKKSWVNIKSKDDVPEDFLVITHTGRDVLSTIELSYAKEIKGTESMTLPIDQMKEIVKKLKNLNHPLFTDTIRQEYTDFIRDKFKVEVEKLEFGKQAITISYSTLGDGHYGYKYIASNNEFKPISYKYFWADSLMMTFLPTLFISFFFAYLVTAVAYASIKKKRRKENR